MAKTDIIGNLPAHITYKIFTNLTKDDIENSLKCCKKWKEAMSYEFLWKSLNQKFYLENKEPKNSEFYREQLRSHSLYWEGRYMYNRAVQFNVANNIFKKVPVQLNEISLAAKCFCFDDRITVLADKDPTRPEKLLVINSSTGLIELELPPVNNLMVIIHGNLLIYITLEFHLKIWNIETKKYVTDTKMPLNHNRPNDIVLRACGHLVLIQAWRHRVSTLYSFDMKTEEFTYHRRPMRVLRCTNDIIAIAKNYETVEIVDLNFNTLAMFNCSTVSNLLRVEMNDNFFVKFSFNNIRRINNGVTVWDITNKTNFIVPLEDLNMLKGIKLTSNKNLICITYNRKVEVWDMSKQDRLFSIVLEEPFFEVIINDLYIFITLGESRCEVWCLKTGTFVGDLCVSRKSYQRSYLTAVTNTKLLHSYTIDEGIPDQKWRILDYETNLKPTKSSRFSFLNIPRYILSLILSLMN